MCFGVCASLPASTVSDNSVNDLTARFNPGPTEVGDQIVFAGTDRRLTLFSFEYWGAASGASFAGPVKAEVKIYRNNGPLFNGYATPGDVVFDSHLFSVPSPTARSTFVFTEGSDWAVGGLILPDTTMTWSVQFSGFGTGDRVGVDLYSPPVVGSDYPDYWENRVGLGDWTLLTNSGPMDFGAKFEAVPEPSAVVFSVGGGLGILALVRRLRRAN